MRGVHLPMLRVSDSRQIEHCRWNQVIFDAREEVVRVLLCVEDGIVKAIVAITKTLTERTFLVSFAFSSPHFPMVNLFERLGRVFAHKFNFAFSALLA